ncbi:MAG: DUF6456 domain-containing protein [Halocynthiibacter sp.]
MHNPNFASSHEGLPPWLPSSVMNYLSHVEGGQSIRALARDANCHASTILRQIRKFEARRDDPLMDEALDCLGMTLPNPEMAQKKGSVMSAPVNHNVFEVNDRRLNKEAVRILRKLNERGAVLIVAADMDKAAVMKMDKNRGMRRLAVVGKEIVQAFLLKDWVLLKDNGKISQYQITTQGRSALKRLLSGVESMNSGFAEAITPFQAQHRVEVDKIVDDPSGSGTRRVKYNMSESPVMMLARRKDRNGVPFLTSDLVAVGEQIREDFELAQLGPKVGQNWDNFLTGGACGGIKDSGIGSGAMCARDRVHAAFTDLGPGLSDVVLRCCCYLEGVEATEREMGWAARSGKVVLRIALQRLKQHYEQIYGPHGPMIG